VCTTLKASLLAIDRSTEDLLLARLIKWWSHKLLLELNHHHHHYYYYRTPDLEGTTLLPLMKALIIIISTTREKKNRLKRTLSPCTTHWQPNQRIRIKESEEIQPKFRFKKSENRDSMTDNVHG
jgi:hypothetical protein